ncbi:MAG TPA: hypothetical protein VJZ01_05125 [Lachnospiraceae bacterium]|nr:hypothetical protein [Lachnospiraceae bacterium]
MGRQYKKTIKINKEIYILAFLLIAGITKAYCEEIVIMPISYYENRILQVCDHDITMDIGERLDRFHTVLIDKSLPSIRDAGISEDDLKRVANMLAYRNSNYILYGSLHNEDVFLRAEFHLYDRRNERTEVFFSSDNTNQYDRLIRTVADNILDWLHTRRDKSGDLQHEILTLRQEIEQIKSSEVLSKDEEEKEEEKPPREPPIKEVTLRIPVRFGYWTFINREWVERVQGTFEGNTGVEFIPELQFPAIGGMRNEISFDLLLGYRFGINAGTDPINVHGIIVNPGITYHLNFYTNNWVLFGIGFLYEYRIWKIEEESFGVASDYNQALTGLSVFGGYRYQFNRWVSVDLGTNAYIYFASGASLVMHPYLGTTITILGGENSSPRK